ncbi:MAG: TetR/AcrR family transcriptional regulator [Bacteroidota bacterium]
MKTRERILEEALKLFNEQGVSTVSSKTISQEMGISYGNLCYHFPKKDDIILELYLSMQKEVDEQFKNIEKEIFEFDFMLMSLGKLMGVFYKYKFIFLGFSRVNRRFDEIKRHAQQQFEKRKTILRNLTNFLIAKGYVKYEKIEGHYEKFIHGLLILFNSWITDSEFFYKGKPEEKISYYLELLFSIIRPTLTSEGAKAFAKVYESEEFLKFQ